MAKAPCCWASNELSRDKENYIRCSTRPKPKSTADTDNKDKGKKGKIDKNMCCGPAFRLQQAKEAEIDVNEEIDRQCDPALRKKYKIKLRKENFHCFTANMICMKLYMPGRDFEFPSQLKITASICKGCKPLMCADRINVNCLPRQPSARFSMLAECLAKALSEGITLSVSYMKKEIGRGCYVPPNSVIQRMTTTLQEVVHTAEVELTCNGCTVGMATVRLSMLMQSQNIEVMDTDMDLCSNDNDGDDDDDDDYDDGDYDDDDDCCCGTTGDKSQSIPTSSDPCRGFVGVDESSDDSNKNRPRNGGGSEPAKLVDVAGPYNIYSCPNRDDGCLNVEDAPAPGGQFAFGARCHLGDGNTNRLCPQISAPQLKQMGIKRQRECPMCKEDVSWLPQIAACPHCGYKQLPIYEEEDYDEGATAKDIINQLFQRKGSSEPKSSSKACLDSDPKTEEAFEMIVNNYRSLQKSIKKCQSQTCPHPHRTDSAPKQKRPQTDMFTVFTELKKLFETGADENGRKAKIEDICDEACKLAKAKAKSLKSSAKRKDPCFVAKKRKRPKKSKLQVKSRIYEPIQPMAHPRQSHLHCYSNEHKVPAHMGWLWTHNPLAQRPGWRPGAIRRSIRQLMAYFLKDFPVDSIPISKYMSYHKHKPHPAEEEHERAEDLVQLQTLHIEKKNDELLITLRPLKDPETLKRAANPYANMKPIQFRIVKNPLLKQVRAMKRCLKNMGFSKCRCHRPVMQCYCRSFIDKQQLVEEVQRQCQRRNMPDCENELVLSDTTDSEQEFEFGVTPPAGRIRPERLKVTHMTNTETQYNENDWAMPTMFPHPPNAQVQYGGCVMGERTGRFPWIFGKGFVHRVPKPPKMRNPPKPKRKRAFPGAPLPRETGGFNSPVQRHNSAANGRKDTQLSEDSRLQRLNQAAHPPTAKQFQQLPPPSSRKVQFSSSATARFTT